MFDLCSSAGKFMLRLLTLALLSFWWLPMSGSTFSLELTPSEVTVFEGETATFNCTPHILPETLVLVRHNSTIVKGPRLEYLDVAAMGSSDGYRSYMLSGVSRADNGERFRCILSGTIESTEALLRVYVPPKLSGTSGRVYVMENSQTLKTFDYNETEGLPPPHSYLWLYNGRTFGGNSRVRLENGNKTLTVRRASREDTGIYTLTAISDSGQSSLELDLNITYDEFFETPESVEVEEGDRATFTCKHRFGLNREWILQNPGSTQVMTLAENRTLVYGPVSHRDHLQSFICRVLSLDKENFFTSVPAVLKVLAPPVITVEEASVEAVENRDSVVILTFSVKSFPPLLSQVFRHDGQAVSDRVTPLANGSVRILNPTRTDAGNYSLTVTNARGRSTASILLSVHYAPEIEPLEEPFVTQDQRPARIPCGSTVNGSPHPTFRWTYSEGERVELPMPARFSVDAGSGELVVTRAVKNDSGVYKCSATNSIGNDSTIVEVSVLEPPGPPEVPSVIDYGRTWGLVSWSPPTLKPEGISMYSINATPQAFSGDNGDHLVFDTRGKREEGSGNGRSNSSCIEVTCEPHVMKVPSSQTTANLTGLVPALQYSVVISAFSHGSRLQSQPSEPVTFITLTHVPGIGSVTSTVLGPSLANISWTLAFSGGLPVEAFHIEFRRNDSLDWRRAVVMDRGMDSTIPSSKRSQVVGSLEAEEYYVFRVAASNGMGRGEYVETSQLLLSHQNGVPSPPTQPQIISWDDNSVTISTTVTKFGSEQDFILSSILVLSDAVVSTGVGMSLADNYTLGSELRLRMRNVSYRGDLRFAVIAFNHLGSSLASELSLRARENIQDSSATMRTAGIAVWSLLSVLNTFLLATAMIFCRILSCQAKKQKKSLQRRVEMSNREHQQRESQQRDSQQRDHQQNDCPFSPRSVCTFGDYRSSPDGRSTNVAISTTPNHSPVKTSSLHHTLQSSTLNYSV